MDINSRMQGRLCKSFRSCFDCWDALGFESITLRTMFMLPNRTLPEGVLFVNASTATPKRVHALRLRHLLACPWLTSDVFQPSWPSTRGLGGGVQVTYI